jgi:NADH-quinone oxidoreductase subunit E
MMDVKNNGKVVIATVRSAVEKHGAHRTEMVPILLDLNQSLGYLPSEALKELSRLLRVPLSEIFTVASFYQMLATKPRGRHVIQFCESAPCHVAGGRLVWQALKDELKLEPGETSTDGKWTLITTSCLGACGVGPVILVDEDIFGNINPDQVPGILARYQ